MFAAHSRIAHHPHDVYAAPVSALIRNAGFSDPLEAMTLRRLWERQHLCQVLRKH